MTNKKSKILGYNVDLLNFDESVSFSADKMKNSEGLHVVTINPEIIALADKNKDLAGIINNSQLVLPESIGIKIALMLKGIKQEQIPGIEYAKTLIKICADNSYPVALIGAKEHVITKAAFNLKQEFPSLNIVYSHNGYFEDDEAIINAIAQSGAKLVLCALGAPKQEIFIDKCRKKSGSSLYIGIGGSFDVWAGEVQRAPLFFRNLGLEWLYRTIKQPFRIKRIYKTLPVFLFRAIIDSIKN